MAEDRPVFHAEIGAFFVGLRKIKGWTQRQAEDIAERKKIKVFTRQVLWRLEKGKVKNIDPVMLRAVAELYELPYEGVVARWVLHRYQFDPAKAGEAGLSRITDLERRLRAQDAVIRDMQKIAQDLMELATRGEEVSEAPDIAPRRSRKKTV
jgi:transcriptional regulator with XRE-family HTH domain